MGAHECSNLSVGRHKNAKEAYKELVNNAKYWRGHDAYNGTISTSDGFNMVNKHPRFGTKRWNKFETPGAPMKSHLPKERTSQSLHATAAPAVGPTPGAPDEVCNGRKRKLG